jgi:RecG-like helicase
VVTGVSPTQNHGGGRPRPPRRASSPTPEPDVLVMTATPIPRTLALTLYGDLDVSVLDELPPGRTPVVTRSVSDERAPEVWDFVRKQIAAGHQAYVVYPVIEENEERELKAASRCIGSCAKRFSPTCMSVCCTAVSMPTKKSM